jgi:uncharacterized membrane protein (DUF2068 family)
MSIIAGDFKLNNTWREDETSPLWCADFDGDVLHSPEQILDPKTNEVLGIVDTTTGRKYWRARQYLIDQTTGRRYFNESKGCIRTKCALSALATPVVHTVAAIVNIAYRILRIVTCADLWRPKKATEDKRFKARLWDMSKNLLRIAAAPLAIVALEAAALYGVFRPLDGRKLYATIERAEYESFILAPCFQPEPEKHALGGDIKKRDSF